MFTGIVETIGEVVQIFEDMGNLTFQIRSAISGALKVDQSLAHNGVCLTVIQNDQSHHWVTAIHETLIKTNMSEVKQGDLINLERCLKVGDRFDGHMVQGHVDLTGRCVEKIETNGSWKFSFEYDQNSGHLTVPKGSICVNGTSLTVVDSLPGYFSVAIIPYTFTHTNFNQLRVGSIVNLEFDIMGKYFKAYMEAYSKNADL
jgi:riboflavin synthase